VVSFALVTEGITDQVCLEAVLGGWYKGSDEEVEVNSLQPLRDTTDEARQNQESPGGWERVLEYCSSLEYLKSALEFNDYLIVQIDTDCCDHVNFGVSRSIDGREKSVGELIDDVVSVIKSKMPPQIIKAGEDCIFFAVAVDSLECWILPLYAYNKADSKRTISCEKHLNQALNRKDIRYEKTYEVYRGITADLRNMRNIKKCQGLNQSFDIFLQSLPDHS
jgi:hypothetical protein